MRVALLLALALLWNPTAEAQQRPRLAVLVQQLDEEAARCGIYTSSIESIAALTLRNNGILADTGITNPALYVLTTVYAAQDTRGVVRRCVFGLMVSVRGFRSSDSARAPIGGFNSRGRTFSVLCEHGGTFVSSQSDAGTFLAQHLENNIKLCLGDLEY